MKIKQLTLCVVHQHSKVLLGLKKRGFGAGKWNGFGGKVREGEMLEDAARRELFEEAGIEAQSLIEMGFIDFEFQKTPGEILRVYIYKVGNFSGRPTESDEMQPRWFIEEEIPFDTMWPGDKYWFPLLLAGKNFEGYFLFGEDDIILKQELRELRLKEVEFTQS